MSIPTIPFTPNLKNRNKNQLERATQSDSHVVKYRRSPYAELIPRNQNAIPLLIHNLPKEILIHKRGQAIQDP